jgi:hypothetical protein
LSYSSQKNHHEYQANNFLVAGEVAGVAVSNIGEWSKKTRVDLKRTVLHGCGLGTAPNDGSIAGRGVPDIRILGKEEC